MFYSERQMLSVVAVSPLMVRHYPKSGVTTLPSWVTELVGVPSEAPKVVSGALSVQIAQRSEFMLVSVRVADAVSM